MFGRIALYVLHNVIVGAAVGVGIEATSHLIRRSALRAAEKAEESSVEVANAFTRARDKWRKRMEARNQAKAEGIVVDEHGVIVG